MILSKDIIDDNNPLLREISEKAIDEKVILNEKPVKTAVAEFANGDYKLIEDPRLKK